MRIAQWDILRFSVDPAHVSPEFPDGYWPEGDAPPDPSAWDRSVEAFRADLRAMMDLVLDPKTDLFAPIPHGQGQTILREALLVADHNAYHLGQLVTVRRLLGAWPEELSASHGGIAGRRKGRAGPALDSGADFARFADLAVEWMNIWQCRVRSEGGAGPRPVGYGPLVIVVAGCR